MQFGGRHARGPAAGGLCGHRGGVRRGPGRGEVLRHQVPQGGPEARRGSGRGDHPFAEDERRRSPRTDLEQEDVEALRRGCENLGRHVANVRRFGLPVVVAINHFTADTASRGRRGGGLRRIPGRRGLALSPLGGGLGRDRGPGPQGRRPARRRRGRLPAAVSRRHAPVREDRDGRARDLWGRLGERRPSDPQPARPLAPGGLRRAARVHGQDPVQLLDRPHGARRAHRPRRARARGPARGRRRLRRGDLRGDHDHAGPAQAPRRRADRPGRRAARSSACSRRARAGAYTGPEVQRGGTSRCATRFPAT